MLWKHPAGQTKTFVVCLKPRPVKQIMIPPIEEIQTIKLRIFRYLIRTRRKKYRWFLRAVRSLKYFPTCSSRGHLLEVYYALMRYIDDVVDGDFPLPAGYPNVESYLLQKIAFSANPVIPDDNAELMMLYCFEYGKPLGIDLSVETDSILSSMLFDAKRRGTCSVSSRQDLMRHFYLMDIKGTLCAALKLFKEDVAKYPAIEPLGIACRISYNLKDFSQDIKTGYMNICREDCERLGLASDALADQEHPAVSRWRLEQAQQGLDLIEEHENLVKKENFRWLTRLVLWLVYKRPTRRHLRQVLSENRNAWQFYV